MTATRALLTAVRTVSPATAARLAHRRHRRETVWRVIDAAVTEGSVAVDVGASIGVFSARLLALTGRSGSVHAVEPNPDSIAALRRFERRGLTLHPVALSDRDATGVLRVPEQDGRRLTGLSSLEPEPGDGGAVAELAVPIRRFDTEFAALERLDFVKCDVEGHEPAVIAGALDALRTHRPAVVIEIEQRHRAVPVADTFAQFASLGYDGWALTAGGLAPLAEFDVERDQLAHLRGMHGPAEAMPPGYVGDFLFTARPLGALTALLR